ncbi:Peroxisomal membrane protein PMP27 [Thoreauomyces humboldtii]|nr:Peroxisomal membrane protein PMP27 [Thoreauomyces humboldtii]
MNVLISPQLHDHTVRYLGTSVGRDKIHRFVQYFTRFLVWHGQRNGYEKETLTRMTNLMAALGSTRKLMRVGRQVEFARTIQKASLLKDDVARVTLTVKQVFLALWLAHDSCQWANSAGIVKFDNIKEISKRGMKFWFVALVASIIGNVHKLRLNTMKLEHETKTLRASQAKAGGPDESAVQTIKTLRADRMKVTVATVQDCLDILIPASGLEYVKIESGIVGLIGATTAAMGAVMHWRSLQQ